MKIKVQGNFAAAKQELLQDKNNAVAFVYDKNTKAKEIKNKLLDKAIFTIKNIFATDDAPTDAASMILKNFQPFYNATCVRKLINAGARKIAKVNCDELALGGTGTYSAYGLITNPCDHQRLVGGSSSGSAATLTKNISFALASDTGDSVRLPASYVGLVGFKPSYGAISRYGMFAYASSLDTVSYFAHNTNDIVLISQALYGKDKLDMTSTDVKIQEIKKIKPHTIGILDVREFLEPFLIKEYNKLINKLQQERDIKVELIKPNLKVLRAIKAIYDIISYSEACSNLANLNGIAFANRKNGKNWEEIMTNTRSQGFGLMIQRRLTLGSYFTNEHNQTELFVNAQIGRNKVRYYFNELHKKYDILIYPASANVAPYIDKRKNKNYDFMEYILTGANLAGNPSLSLKWVKHNNLFVNLTLDAKIYEDQKLLSNALWVEEFLGVENA